MNSVCMCVCVRESIENVCTITTLQYVEVYVGYCHACILMCCVYVLQLLPDCLDDLLLPLSHHTAADMFVIGTQESTPSK